MLEERHNSDRHFAEEEIQQVVESVLYTLSFLEAAGVAYPDLSPRNIHRDHQHSSYKLLPLSLIPQSAYELALGGEDFGLPSPELILGLRCGEREVGADVLNGSNVFTLGMVLLEMATLQPSCECYDEKLLEVLDDVITERLERVQELYHPQIARLIETMLEYDFSKRVDLQGLAVVVNRALAQRSLTQASLSGSKAGFAGSSTPMKKTKSFSRFRTIDESLSHEKTEKGIFRAQER